MSKKNGVKIKIPIYERVLRIIITNDVNRAIRDIDKSISDSEIVEATVIEDEDGDINLILKPNADINTICHESFHIATGVLQDVGMELTDSSEEGYAYLVGWVAEKIQKELNNEKLKKII